MNDSTKRKSERKIVTNPLNNMGSVNKRRKFSKKIENESSTHSFTYFDDVPSDSEGSSDSEFYEHPYSVPASQFNKRLHNSRPMRKSNLNIRGSFLDNDLEHSKRTKCTSKNAVMARMNRLKKKKYIEELQNKNTELEVENQKLKSMLEIRVKEVESLKKKANNLENVIRNSTEIGSLLRCVRQHTDLEISSSLLRSGPNNCQNTEMKAHAQNPTLSDVHKLDTAPSEEEGNEILNPYSKLVDSTLEFLEINNCDPDVVINPLLPDVENWFKPSGFEFPESPGYDGNLSPTRCETPSNGFAVSAIKENLFGDIGVCFHIANKKVSLEFCDTCNHMASL